MSTSNEQDPIWQAAWAWVRRQHEPGGFSAAARREFVQWLAADASHRQTYEEAAQLWLLVGLVPPSRDLPDPDCED